jgi:hypothetical protein
MSALPVITSCNGFVSAVIFLDDIEDLWRSHGSEPELRAMDPDRMSPRAISSDARISCCTMSSPMRPRTCRSSSAAHA